MDLTISQLPELLDADLRGPDLLPLADVSASETKKITTAALFKQGMQILPAGSINGNRLIAGSVSVNELGADSVTAVQLAGDAVDTAALQDSAVTDVKITNGVNGTKISPDTLPASSIDPASLDRGIDRAGGAIGIANAVGAGGVSGITWNDQGLVTGGVRLKDSDLPIATETTIGGISVPADSGLTVSSAGVIDHQALMAPGTTSGITYDEHGHLTGAVPLTSSDMPIATNVDLGGVAITPGTGLSVDSSGFLSHADSGVAPGDYAKVTVDAQGHVTAGLALDAADIPDLDAGIITSGQLSSQFIADGAVINRKLGDYAISYIQESTPPIVNVPAGTLWYQESTAGLHMWNGNSWMPVSIGRLSQENLRYCGIIDASSGLITGVTPFGTAAGYKIGDALRTASDSETGVYFVIAVPGNGIGVTPGVTYDNGDWVLCNGQVSDWARIDTLSAGGSGGGATNLDDLLNVDSSKTAPDRDVADNRLLMLNPVSNLWEGTLDVNGGKF